MPKVTTALTANYQSIQLPVATQIARDVMKLCNMDLSTPLFIKDEFGQFKQPGSDINADDGIRFGSTSQVVVEVVDTIQNESITNQKVRDNNEPPYIEDRQLGLSVRPTFMVSNLELRFRYRAASKGEAQQWRDEMASRRAEYRQAIHHQVNYKVPIHDGVLGLIAEIWSKREKIAGYGQTFPEYFKEICCVPTTAIGTYDGDPEKLVMAFPGGQVEISGWFDFDEIPQEVKNDSSTTWTIEFTYRTRYQRPTHLYLAYPLMVHQQLVQTKFFSKEKKYEVADLELYGSIGVAALHEVLKNQRTPPLEATAGMIFPYWDDWMPGYKSQPTRTIPAASWMISLDPKDPQDVLNLEKIPDVRFTLEMINYLKAANNRLTKRGGGSVLFTLYENSVRINEDLLTLDENLNIRTTRPLDLRCAYHLRMSFPTYYPYFQEASLILMSDHPVATLQVFQSIVYNLDVEKALKETVVDDVWLPREYIQWFYGWLFDRGIGGGGNPANEGSNGGGYLPGGGNGGTGGNGGSGGNNGGGNTGGGTPGSGGDFRFHGGRWVQFLAIIHKRKTKGDA